MGGVVGAYHPPATYRASSPAGTAPAMQVASPSCSLTTSRVIVTNSSSCGRPGASRRTRIS
jgi:hypothetical protein